MRKVLVYKYEPIASKPFRKKVENGTGVFHEWGVSYQEADNGAGVYSTAIVEMPDGTVRNVPAENIKFLEKPE